MGEVNRDPGVTSSSWTTARSQLLYSFACAHAPPHIILYSVINISWKMSRGHDSLQFVPFSLQLSPMILNASRHLPSSFLGTSAPTGRLLLTQGQKDVAFRQGNFEVAGLLRV